MMAFLAGLGIGLVGGAVGGAVFALWTAREASRMERRTQAHLHGPYPMTEAEDGGILKR